MDDRLHKALAAIDPTLAAHAAARWPHMDAAERGGGRAPGQGARRHSAAAAGGGVGGSDSGGWTMTMMDDELRRLLAAAPPGPWRTMQSYAGPWWVGRTGPCGCQRPDCDRGFTVVDDEHGAELAAAAPALAAAVLRLRAERDALRGIVVRLAGDDGMYSDDYGMHCLCGFKRGHGDGCLRAEAQALLGGER